MQCGNMEAKTLSFVLHTAGCEHHHLSTRRMLTYVVGGRVGMNDACHPIRSVVSTAVRFSKAQVPHPLSVKAAYKNPCDYCIELVFEFCFQHDVLTVGDMIVPI